MSEDKVVKKTKMPATIESLQTDLRALGIRPGMVVLVHSSLSAMGWVCGGSVAVVTALQKVLGSTGTLVMPAHSSGLGARVVVACNTREYACLRSGLTPTRAMGIIAETFRKQRGVLRSSHPLDSFCACGPQASHIVNDHSLSFGMGEHSPLARIYDLHGFVLLLGVGHGNNTSMHLAEYRATFSTKRIVQEGAPISVSGSRRWATFEDVDIDSSDFDRIGEDFLRSEAGHAVRRGRVGLADCQLMPQRDVVDFTVGWLEENRSK